MSTPGLSIVIPVKPFALAKQRLSPVLSADERRTLARSMLLDVIDAVRGSQAAFRLMLVSGDVDVAALAQSLGIRLISEPSVSGLNAAVGAACRDEEVQADGAMLVLPADIPGVASSIIDDAISSLAANRSLVLAGASEDGGTNLFGCRPPGLIQPCFGPDSFRSYRQAGRAAGLHPRVLTEPGLNRDLDRPADLAAFVARETPTRSWRLLRAFNIGQRLQAFFDAHPDAPISSFRGHYDGEPTSVLR